MSVLMAFLQDAQKDLQAAELQAQDSRNVRDMLLQRLWEEGYSAAELGRLVGLTRERVGQIVRPFQGARI